MKEDLDVIVADDPDVYYLERNYIPGVCVKYPNKTASWTPIKISRSHIRAANSDTSDDDDNECVCLDYQPADGMPGFEIDTKGDSFWALIAHRTRTQTRLNSNNT